LRYCSQGPAPAGRRFLFAAGVALTIWSGSALAVQPDEILKDPALESRARALSQELRCMVCQNQSIDDSDAPLAKDLRVLVRERLSAGDSDNQVIDFLVARYGEFVLLKPRVTAHTLLLWLAPFAALVIGGWGVIAFIRRRGSGSEAAGTQEQLTPAERSRVAELLKEPGQS
jgi:cytochrome c-type biogenesis protein CcmH